MLQVGFVATATPTDGVVFGVRPDGQWQPAARAAVDHALLAKARAARPQFTGAMGEVLPFLTAEGWRILFGLGTPADESVAAWRDAGGALFAAVAALGPTSLTVQLDLPATVLAELAYGLQLRSWQVPARYRSQADPERVVLLQDLHIVTDAPAAAEACSIGRMAVARGVAWTRDLTVAPANDVTPAGFEKQIEGLRAFGVEIEIIDPRSAGLNLLQAVGQGSAVPPRLILLHWHGAPATDRPIAFVGKGITFDTGGIDIKPRLHLEEMKGDMAGAAAVAGVIRALAERRAPVHAIGVLAIAENMPSGGAVRPGDVVTAYNGLSVEIIDTDAEGRLVLADALAYVAARFSPSRIIDLATLTGAIVVTLGTQRAGLFTNDDSLAVALCAAGETEHEQLWRMPLTEIYDDALRSDIADLRNCTWVRGPDALHAARFLSHFVPEGIVWAHLDIAGMSETAEDRPLSAKGPTGFGVRLLDRLVADLYEG